MSSGAREIITVQVGHYANYVGTQWWNLQESSFNFDPNKTTGINHDFLFRTGVSQMKQETYTPRLLVIDSKNSLGSLRPDGALYDKPVMAPSSSDAMWDGEVHIINQLSQDKNQYLHYLDSEDVTSNLVDMEASPDVSGTPQMNLTPEVNVWSDFLGTNLHPNTITTLKDIQHFQCEDAHGEGWGFNAGANLFRKEETEEEIIDKIRNLAEASDSLQGFQLMTDAHNGMGGVSWKIAEHLDDSYHSKNVFTFLATPPNFHPSSLSSISLYVASIVLCYSELNKFSSLVNPLNLVNHSWDLSKPSQHWAHLSYQMDHPYHTGSILAAYIDTATMLYRSNKNPMAMNQVSSSLTPYNRKFVAGDFAFPLGIGEEEFLEDWIVNSKESLRSVTSNCDSSKSLSVAQVVRGVAEPRMRSSKPSNLLQLTPWNHVQYLMQENCKSGDFICNNIQDPITCRTPFPQIFTENVNKSGWASETPRGNADFVKSCPAVARMSQTFGMHTLLKEIYDRALRIRVKSTSSLIAEGIDEDMWAETLEDFKFLVNTHKDS